MAKLDEVLKLVRLYEEKYRHPNLTRFLVSNKYDLFPAALSSAGRKHPRRRRKRPPPETGKKLPLLWTPRTSRKPWTTGIPRIPAHSKNATHHLQAGGSGYSRSPGPKLPVRLGYAPAQQIRQCPFRAGVCSVLQG